MFLNVFCRMRFVFHIKSPNILGGIERSVITRCNYLVNHGHEAYILCKDFFDPEDFTIVPIDSRVKVVDYTALMHLPEKPYFEYSLKWLLGKFKYFYTMDRFINRIKPDFIIRRQDVFLFEFFFLPHHGAKFIAEWSTTIDPEEIPYEYNHSLWLKWMSWHVDRYVFLTSYDPQIFPGPKNKAVVIPTAVDLPEECSPLTSKVVVSTGRLAPIKNYPVLIAAWSQVALRHPDWQLHIYGDGEQHDELELLNQIKELGLEGKVILKGKTDDIHSVLLGASIFALASKGEGFSNSILEAIAHGLPIVVTEMHCTHDLMEGFEIGYKVPQDDISQLAASINSLIEDESLRRQMGANDRRRSLDYSCENVFSQHLALYRKLLSKK